MKFTPENDKIEISYTIDESVSLKVFNYGIPITKEKIKEVEENNTRITSEYGTSNEIGTGIGLLLIKQYLKSNHAHLDITPQPNGTEFKISFDVYKFKTKNRF
ncbi:ATP-binding protein [Mesonia aestuariivivens]|uniref:ATP-binding protein n=1 Tax=Mesonia aestuariivivens TaxID=2796128 RepID=UPI0034E2196E